MAAAKRTVLGPCACPLCGGAAEVRLSESGFAYIAMDCCKAQLFTRGPRSDELARDRIGGAAAPAAAPAEETRYQRHERIAKEPAPAPDPVRTSEPVQAPAPAPAPSPGFGLRWL